LGVEYLSFLRTGIDVRAEYENSDELKRLRDGYILHILDYVLQDRARVHYNDLKIMEENNRGMITLDNVFDLAKE
jgi:hypothetical protein